ncbi:MAG TPA: FtsX-like permease family protein [Candidatus Dormibacteraeota bacterium]|nr:FtsX-like permease family protein [Candidatus Dormibacteraeota bacterium]
MIFLVALFGLFVLAYLAISVVVVRRPLIGRIAFREATRRPSQTAVLVLGLMVAGASIFSIQVLFDSMYATQRAQLMQLWGRDDVEVSGGGTSFDAGLAQRLATDSAACSCIAAVQNADVTSGSVVDLNREVGKPNVQITGLDLAAEQRFGSFVLAGGKTTLGDELNSGGIFLTQPLADTLGARAGDQLRVFSGTSSHDLTVAGIVRREEQGAYGFDRSIFTSLPTAQMLAGTDRVNLIRVSARGEGDAEVSSGRAVAQNLRGLLATDGSSLQVLEGKRATLELLVKSSESGRPFATFFGVLVALAATALVANLAVALSEERRPRLAVLRAMGLTRTGLIQLSTTEGAIYSLLGAIAGLPAGLIFAFVILHGPGGPASSGHLVFSMRLESLLGAVAAAALMNLATVFLASLRTNGMAISSAIRDLPEAATNRRLSRKLLVFYAIITLGGLASIAWGRPWMVLLGGALLIAGAAGFVQGRISDRVRYSAAAAGAATWAIVDLSYGPHDSGPGPFAFALVITVFALSVLVATNLTILDRIVGLAGRVSAGSRAALRPAMAYSSRRPMRSGLVIAAFSIVMTMLILAQGLLNAETNNYQLNSGGWDVQAVVAGTDQLTLPADLQSRVAKQGEFPSRTFLGPVNWVYPASDFRGTTDWQPGSVTVFGLSQAQLDSGIGFANPGDWAALARDPNLVASPEPVGSVVSLATGHGTLSFRVAAQFHATTGTNTNSIVPGLIASRATLDLLTNTSPGALLLLGAAPGQDAGALARDLQRATLSNGADVITTRALLADDIATSYGIVNFIILLMRVGLLVGIASLGAVALRAVVERRRSIGMLRAIGYQPAQVLAGLLAETVAVATAGLAVGVAAAYALGGPFNQALAGAGFNLDLGSIFLTVGLVYLAVLLVTFLPALRAARLQPADALRTVG